MILAMAPKPAGPLGLELEALACVIHRARCAVGGEWRSRLNAWRSRRNSVYLEGLMKLRRAGSPPLVRQATRHVPKSQHQALQSAHIVSLPSGRRDGDQDFSFILTRANAESRHVPIRFGELQAALACGITSDLVTCSTCQISALALVVCRAYRQSDTTIEGNSIWKEMERTVHWLVLCFG